MSTHPQYSSTADINRFLLDMEKLVAHGFKEGSRSMEVLQGLPEERRKTILQKLEADIAFFEDASRAGIPKYKSVDLLRHFLSKSGWVLADEVYSRLSDGDVIEVYSPTFTQLFRNMRFLEICSYSILDIYMYEWPELYTRPQSITEALIHECMRSLQAKPGENFFGDSVPNHFLEEVFSEERRVFEIEQKFISPIRCAKTGAVMAMLGCLAARVHSKRGQPKTVVPLGRPVSGSGSRDSQ
jgi:hypothetical protein